MIQRDLYLHQLVSYMWDGQIKVITGIRRCGKSVLLFELFRDYLLSQGVSAENIITIELDKRKDVKYRSPIALSSMVEAKIQPGITMNDTMARVIQMASRVQRYLSKRG